MAANKNHNLNMTKIFKVMYKCTVEFYDYIYIYMNYWVVDTLYIINAHKIMKHSFLLFIWIM